MSGVLRTVTAAIALCIAPGMLPAHAQTAPVTPNPHNARFAR